MERLTFGLGILFPVVVVCGEMKDEVSVVAGVGKTKLDSGWIAARSTEVELDGIQLTTAHPPSAGTGPWMEAVVPGT